jgi:hypothetical protein
MKTLYTITLSVFLYCLTGLLFNPMRAQVPQVPQGINYQGVARNTSGVALTNQAIGLRFTFHSGSPTGPTAYQETHSVTTSSLGLFSLVLGAGTPVSGTFSTIDWVMATYLEVEMDPAGGTSYTAMGTAQMVSVPYAQLAQDAIEALDSVKVTARLTGNGTDSLPLDIAQQGALTGQVLRWNGASWSPGSNGVDTLWEGDALGGHLRNPAARLGIGSNAVADVKLYVKDSTLNTMDGVGAIKLHPNDTYFGLWGAHYGKGTGVGASNYGTAGHALLSFTDDPTGTNTDASARFFNISRGPGIEVICLDANSLAPGVLIQNGSLSEGLRVEQFPNAANAAVFKSMGANNANPTLQVDHMGTGGAAFFDTAPTCNNPAVLISQDGAGGNGLLVAAGNAANTENAVHVINEGRGMGLAIQNLNTTSVQPAFSVNNVGTAGAANLTHNNAAGTAFNLISVNATNGVPAMRVQNNGTNDAGYFLISNAGNTEVAVHGETNGTGSAGFFEATGAAYAGSALEVSCGGTAASRAANFVNAGLGISCYASKPLGSSGRAGHFQNFNGSNGSDCVLIQTNAFSGGVYALHTNNTGGGKGILISGDGDVGGDFDISGLLSKGGGSFKIDHPLDPENKFLYHSFVESPDMLNIYNGTVTLDANGRARVELPDWFEALNSDFRYQLTCIGGFAPVYVAGKVSGNAFEVAGGTAGLEVSWQVTGVRKDPFAQAQRIQVEVEKTAEEKGYYLYPAAYGVGKERGIMERLARVHGGE